MQKFVIQNLTNIISYQEHKKRWGRYTKLRSKTVEVNHPLFYLLTISFLFHFCLISLLNSIFLEKLKLVFPLLFFLFLQFSLGSNRLRVPIWYGLSHELMVLVWKPLLWTAFWKLTRRWSKTALLAVKAYLKW